ncbi:MAG: helix-turn-helix transcriptional regulator [Pirellulales bacterium]|nr:helix-turn-helix transcriptional regulator [Pirellulales bacterium]
MARKQPTIIEQLNKILDNSGVSRYRISRETGIPESTLSRLASGKQKFSPRHLDTLAKLFQIELVPHKPNPIREQ